MRASARWLLRLAVLFALLGESSCRLFGFRFPLGGNSACPLRAQQLAAGSSHACALLTNGTVRCWGSNYAGQLGDGTITFRSAPVEVQGLRDAVAVTAGEKHTCALKRDGTVWCWGANDFGQLGVSLRKDGEYGHDDRSSTPVAIPGFNDVQAIAAGEIHTVALRRNGAVHHWGVLQSWSPDVRKPFPIAVVGARQIAAGGNLACAVTEGDVQCWGARLDYHFGTTSSDPFAPQRLGKSEGLKTLALGKTALCGIDVRGDIHCWGEKKSLAMGSKATNVLQNVVLDGLDPAVGLAISWHMCAVMANGNVACWGENEFSQTGDSASGYGYEAVDVSGASSAVEVVVGESSTCIRTRTGEVLCWGENGYGQLGDGTTESRAQPEEVRFCATTSEPIFPSPPPGARVVAALQRGSCYGSCPVYSVRVYDDGTVIYHGDWYVRVRGGQKTKLSKGALDELLGRFRSIDFLGLKIGCENFHTDASHVRVFYREGARARLIDDYHGCGPKPTALRDLEDAMDRIIGTERWVQRRDPDGNPPFDVRATDRPFMDDEL